MAIVLNRRSALMLAGAFLVGVGLTGIAAVLFGGDKPLPVRPVAEAAPVTDSVVLGTGRVTGVYFPAGGAICGVVNQRRAEHGLRCGVESSAGSQANIGALRNGDIHLGIAQSDWQFHALNGTSAFEADGPLGELRAVFALYAEPLTIVVRQGADIAGIDDLRGARLDVGQPGTSVRAMMELLISASGWDADEIETVDPIPVGGEVAALCSGQVDAILLATGHPNGTVMAMATACEVRLINIEGPAVDEVVDSHPFYARAIIPGGVYPGNLDDVTSFGVGATVVALDSLDQTAVYELVRSVFDDLTQFSGQHPAFGGLREQEMIEGMLTAPLHSGAERYFRERGWL